MLQLRWAVPVKPELASLPCSGRMVAAGRVHWDSTGHQVQPQAGSGGVVSDCITTSLASLCWAPTLGR
jgi:hypothetical protein